MIELTKQQLENQLTEPQFAQVLSAIKLYFDGSWTPQDAARLAYEKTWPLYEMGLLSLGRMYDLDRQIAEWTKTLNRVVTGGPTK